jgi:hypothetical protein
MHSFFITVRATAYVQEVVVDESGTNTGESSSPVASKKDTLNVMSQVLMTPLIRMMQWSTKRSTSQKTLDCIWNI